MATNILPDMLTRTIQQLPVPITEKVCYFHDVRIICRTNHPAILTILDELFRPFPEPALLHGEITYVILAYEQTSQFPVSLPGERTRLETLTLLTGTRLTSYASLDGATEYQRYTALPPVNEATLSVLNIAQGIALTQIAPPTCYQPGFLRRYVLLLALGRLMSRHGFEPCHAAALTAPQNDQQGILLIGSSGSGKTTLSLGCACTGFGLLGDDLVLLRQETGSINAYAITHEVSARPGTLDLWPPLAFLRAFPADHREKRFCTIEQIHAGGGRLQTPIRLLFFPSLADTAQSSALPLSKAGTLQLLLEQCMSREQRSRQDQECLFSLLAALTEQATAYRLMLARGASDGPALLHSLLRGDSA